MRRLAALLALVAAATAAPAQAATVTVQVVNTTYLPQRVTIDVGDTVLWEVVDSGHTVTANDGRFDQPAELEAGETFSWTFTTDDETVSYHCRVHGGMVGVITVGDGSPLPPPGGGWQEIRQVPLDYDTIGEALIGIQPRSLVEVAPRPEPYQESVVISTAGVVVAGTGDDPGDVVIEGGADQADGVLLFADETGLENLTVTGAPINGVRAQDIDSFVVRDVVLEGNGRTGLLVEDAHGGWIERSTANGHRRAGFAAADCLACDTVFTDVTASGNWSGIEIEDATGIVVKSSTITGNGTGIHLRTTWLDPGGPDPDAPQRGSHIYDNDIVGNDAVVQGPPLSPSVPLRTGVGVFVGAGSFNVIQANRIEDHLYGVAITGLLGPSFHNTVTGNAVTGSTAADLAWDGVGMGTCFGANDVTTVEPVALETIYDCSLPLTVGVPYPPIDLAILDHATI